MRRSCFVLTEIKIHSIYLHVCFFFFHLFIFSFDLVPTPIYRAECGLYTEIVFDTVHAMRTHRPRSRAHILYQTQTQSDLLSDCDLDNPFLMFFFLGVTFSNLPNTTQYCSCIFHKS